MAPRNLGSRARTGTPPAVRRVGGWNSEEQPMPSPATRIVESDLNVMAVPQELEGLGTSDNSLTHFPRDRK